MQVGIIGINHKSADVALREKFAKTCQRRFGPSCSAHPSLAYVLLSTCNRTEVYFSSEDLATTHTYLLGVLRADISEDFEHRLYSYFGRDCFFHLACVTSGMDSAIFGETEIQGQVKKAYETALTYQFLPRQLHFLFQKSLKIGKEIRSSKAFQPMPSIEDAIMTAASYLLRGLEKKRALFVGISEINSKIFSRLKESGLQEIVFCNRSLDRLKVWAKEKNTGWIPWEHRSEWQAFDITIFGTKSPEYLITDQTLQSFFHSPKLIVDLCVPRNVDPLIGKRPFITLMNIDQLYRLIDKNQHFKASEIARLEVQGIAQAVSKQMSIFQAKETYRPLPAFLSSG